MANVSYIPTWPLNPLGLEGFKTLKEAFEADGRQAVGVHLTPDQAGFLRWELHQLYGADPGPCLPTLYGLEVLSTDAHVLHFVAAYPIE